MQFREITTFNLQALKLLEYDLFSIFHFGDTLPLYDSNLVYAHIDFKKFNSCSVIYNFFQKVVQKATNDQQNGTWSFFP